MTSTFLVGYSQNPNHVRLAPSTGVEDGPLRGFRKTRINPRTFATVQY